jgi:SAM-dependent methyltransferase
VRQDDRRPFVAALEAARTAAYAPGEYVGQESFMSAGEIRELARRAGVGPGISVLDFCCGIAGPGRLIAAEFGCCYLGVDYSTSALEIATELSRDLPCRFQAMHVPPLPDGRFDVVLLLEAMLAFPDKTLLVEHVARVLPPGGRFAFTVEAGRPLTIAEQRRMPDADTVWLVRPRELARTLAEAGLTVTWAKDCTASHHRAATSLLRSFRLHARGMAARVGTEAVDELIAAHQLWSDWLGAGRVRKFAVVATRT